MGQRVKHSHAMLLLLLFQLLLSLTQSPASKHATPHCACQLPVCSLPAEAHTPCSQTGFSPESSVTYTGWPLPQGSLTPASLGTLSSSPGSQPRSAALTLALGGAERGGQASALTSRDWERGDSAGRGSPIQARCWESSGARRTRKQQTTSQMGVSLSSQAVWTSA